MTATLRQPESRRGVIHVINASSRTDTGITDDISRSLGWAEGFALARFNCVTLLDGPNGITTSRDSDDAAPAVLRFIEREAKNDESLGFVVACFSDPGVFSARELTSKPVVGIGEAGFFAALSMGETVGTISVSAGLPRKSMRLARHIGIDSRVAGHRSLGLDYGQLQNTSLVTERLIEAGRLLREEGADVLLFAAAGLARYVEPLQQVVGIPVVDPTQVAAGVVLSQVMQRAYLPVC